MTHRNSSWNAPYTFSDKEKDVETGYGYFGARYYDSGLSIWLSVDPMRDKYPSMSPYNYCAYNPVIFVDPDGREFEGPEDKAIVAQMHTEYKDKITRYQNELSYATDEKRKSELNGYIKEMTNAVGELTQLEQSEQKYAFNCGNEITGNAMTTYDKTNQTVVMTIDNVLSYDVISHELKHASQFVRRKISFTSDGLRGGYLHDLTDEHSAYYRQEAFRDRRYDRDKVSIRYSGIADRVNSRAITKSNKQTIFKKLNTEGDIYNKKVKL